MIDYLHPDFFFQDDRGTICQLVSGGWNQFNIVKTKAGFRRGRMHYHTKNVEAFYIISGKIEYRCQSIKSRKSERYVFSSGSFWRVNPYVGHDFYFLEDTVHVSMYDLGVDMPDGTRDIVEMEEKETWP